ncbi:S8 family peptidase [Lacrimispora saccharolytica]|uniref:Peptidase S8 and S53 subtilisin kexin sedolisin n=1 Tax=Lacrimispora saccharolytica (strain ATCC 35040 / DSM 2544 / NRCC 2533 / WM1) TaxID=610130 RepID=D9R5B9_LACSW|nr:S8 family peptidase [Lacrimispora saccharolytica]ADL03325.1 peptidase S8 and S53 subtilisin kexin sedolisin [[Clostridium] saccharolyticum WM1]QRV18514.1 S8 family peptidase [Lacrimispora saccharolytica]
MKKILDNNFYDLLITNPVTAAPGDDSITFLNNRHSLLHIPTAAINICNLANYPAHTFPSLYTPTATVSLEQTGVGNVQRNPALALFGEGVIVVIIDTGIDYRHPAFRNSDGSSRILTIWDQTQQEGTPPETFTFGTEYSQETINTALNSEDPLSIVPTTDSNGHGTAIASVIAGTPNLLEAFSGVVPQSDLVIVKLKEAKENLKNFYFVPSDILCFQESDIMFGFRYSLTISERFSRPVVTCIAMGSSLGGHDGRGALSGYLNDLALQPGIGISVSAGNEGNSQRHYFNSTLLEPFYNDFELRIGENDKMFSLEIWSYSLGRVSIDISSPNRESTQQIYPSIGDCRSFNFVFTPTTIYVNNYVFEEETGDQLIFVRFQNTTPGIWRIRVRSVENEPLSFHAWLPAGNLISNQTFFINSSPDTTITSPGNGRRQLTVTAYNQVNNSILGESSRGYTRIGMVKPDIAAPGYQLTCATPGNGYGSVTGTGPAAAHAAGITAMIFEWAIARGNYRTMNGVDASRLMIRGAIRTSTYTYPNNIWGYGQVDVENVFRQLTSI